MVDAMNLEARRDQALRELRALQRVLDQQTVIQARIVRRARRAGASWQDIGDALEVSRQAAFKRWAGQS